MIDDNVIDFTKIIDSYEYVIIANIGGYKSYMHYDRVAETGEETFMLKDNFQNCCIFDKQNADGLANEWRKALPDSLIVVARVEEKESGVYELSDYEK
jgi:hypothetical protein